MGLCDKSIMILFSHLIECWLVLQFLKCSLAFAKFIPVSAVQTALPCLYSQEYVVLLSVR